jgi:hypothetical protein
MQIPIHLDDQHTTTFSCPYGTFAYRKVPFGLCNVPASFQGCMMAVFPEFIEEIVEVFMDDFSVYGKDIRGLLGKLRQGSHEVCGGRSSAKLGKVPLQARHSAWTHYI